MPARFPAFVVDQVGGKPVGGFRELAIADLPDGDVLIEVAHSSLNYKDALAVTGRGKIVRRFPIVVGIDLAGTVVESRAPGLKPGDRVVATGCGLGEVNWGGYARFARVAADAVLPLPPGYDTVDAMAVGTAGFTAMLCLRALERVEVRPGGRPLVVTGAAGGVGSFAILLLARAGHRVAASTGRAQEGDYLRSLGATEIIDRAALASEGPPLGSERWGGGVDTVGGRTLANLLAQTAYGGAVAACGLAGGSDLPTTVFPFILRAVSLLGIGSGGTPRPEREAVWARIARDLPRARLRELSRVEPMSRLPALSEEILAGRVRGRIVIDVTK